MTLMKLDLKRVSEQLEAIDLKLEKQLSFRRNVLLSVVRGVGYAIGASLVAGAIIGILTATIHSITNLPFFGELATDRVAEQSR